MKLSPSMTEAKARRWERYRSKGKWLFVISVTSLYFVGMILVRILSDWYRQQVVGIDVIDIFIIMGLALLFGTVSWAGNEGRYKTFILDQKIRVGMEEVNGK